MNIKFESFSFKKRLKSMISLDIRRSFTSKSFYIIICSCLIAPILILLMTSMMAGNPMTDKNGNIILDELGNPVYMEGFKNVWQMIGSVSSNNGAAMGMDIVSMCNINMVFMAIAVLVCMFVSADFRSGYAKNLFTIRSDKKDYVISKTIIGFIGGSLMLIFFFVGSLLGGAISGISFEMEGFNAFNILMCMITKIGLVFVFASIFVVMSVIGKDKLWLSLIAGLGVSMLLFMMIPIISPLNANIMNVVLGILGGVIFAFGMGAISNIILKKTSLI